MHISATIRFQFSFQKKKKKKTPFDPETRLNKNPPLNRLIPHN